MENRTLLSTFMVTSPLDDGSAGTLRSKIAAANTNSDPTNTITFAPSLAGDTITLNPNPTFRELSITKSLDIEGPGANNLTISGNKASRVFEIGKGATVTLANLTIANGQTSSTGTSGDALGGGGILNDAGATLNLTRCFVVNNQATTGPNLDVFGGGLLNLGSANVTACTFTGNQALNGAGSTFFGGSVGGAIDNFGGARLKVTASTFTGNQAKGAAGGFYGIGGAIENNAGLNNDSHSTAKISDSIFQSNVATGDTGSHGNGGAIDNEGTGAIMTLTNSRLIDNQSIGGDGGNGLGGGMMNFFSSTLTVTNSTFMGNQAKGGLAFGGGINNTSATLTVFDSSLFGNEALTLSPGGIAAGGGVENGALAGPAAPLELTNCTLSGNQAIGGVAAGGGLDVSFNSTASITGCQIINNQALGGAGGTALHGFGLPASSGF